MADASNGWPIDDRLSAAFDDHDAGQSHGKMFADANTILRLARLDTIAYDQIREKEAAALGIRVSTLDTEVQAQRRTTRRRADSNQPSTVLPPRFSDDGLALAFTARHADGLLYVPAWSAWLRWNGCKWAKDDVLAVYDAARLVCRDIAADAMGERGGEDIAKSLTSAGTVAAVERLARSDPRHARSAEVFDADPWLLNTPGGVVDLRTGKLRPHEPADMLTKVAGTSPGGDCPRFLAFLQQITQDKAELIAFLQRFIGYTLTGSIQDHAFLFAYGPGGNGKGVLFSTVAAMMGDYATTAMHDVFTVARNDQHPTNLAALRGARLVAVTETEEGRAWAEARVKAITGGDRISARVMRGNPFEFTPVCKLWFSGNHKPPLKNPDAAMRRRMNLLPFIFVPAKPDTGLSDALRAELPGILAWAIQGCLAWQRDGLKPPPTVTAATDEYFAAQDSLAEWFETNCVREPQAWVTVRTLYSDWKGWAVARGEDAGSEKRFSESMQRFAEKRKQIAGMAFMGVRLITSHTGVPR